MNWEFIEYLPLYEKATVLTVRIGLLGIAFAILVRFGQCNKKIPQDSGKTGRNGIY